MQTAPQNVLDKLQPKHKKNIFFPYGLPAFEKMTNFILIWNENEAPFLWLQSTQDSNLSFITVDPFLVTDNYIPEIAEEDVKLLNIKNEKDVFLLSIINIKNNHQLDITANLLSPIVINWQKQTAKQVILKNHNLYSIKHSIS